MCNSSDCKKIYSNCLLVMCYVMLLIVLYVVFGILLSVIGISCMVYVLECKVGLSFIGSPCIDFIKWYQRWFVNLLLKRLSVMYRLVGEKVNATYRIIQIAKHEVEKGLQVDRQS